MIESDSSKKLRILEESFREGVITEEEFNKQKNQVKQESEQIEEEVKENKDILKTKQTNEEPEQSNTTLKEEKDKKPTLPTLVSNNKKLLIPLLLILFVMSLSVYLRVQPAFFPMADEIAKEQVHLNIRLNIQEDINERYFSLPEDEKNALVETNFRRTLQQRNSDIKKLIKSESDILKSEFQDENGQTYLLAVDPYFWLRHTSNILKNGHPGDSIKDGEPYDDLMYAPVGRPTPPDMFFPYFAAYLFKLTSFFNNKLPLANFFFYVPVLIMTLSAIPAFFIAKRFGGNFAGFIASALLMIHPMALTRTIGGFSDTDSYNVLFPLLIVWVSIELFQSKNKINILLLSLLQGLLIGVYSFTWGSGWWYIFDFILATYIISIGYHFLNHIREIKKGIINFLKIPIIKKTLLLFVLFIFFSGIFVSLFSSFNVFIETPFQPFQFTKIKSIESIWPNVFLSIAEQVQIPFNKVKPMIGELLFMVSLIGALFLITKDTKKKNGLFIILASVGVIFITLIENITQLIILFSLPIIFRFVWSLINKEIKLRVSSSILIILWFVATLFAVEKGVRWLLLFAAPFSILVGIALGNLFKRLSAILTKSFDISKNVLRVSLILLLSLILISPFNESNNSASGTTPVMNDVWYSSLDKINKEASQDAIITSWWDYGHWFKSIGKRAVTFDGASQNTPDIHWVGKILTTTDEKEAIGTLRMVHCRKIMSFNKSDTICPGDGLICKVNAFIRLNGLLDETTKSIKILDEIMPLNKEEARNKLTNYLKDDEQINDMLEFTHCNPLENYFITSSDMIKKSGVWAHFGLWDFNKAQIYSTLNTPEYKDNKQSSLNYLSKKFNFTKEESETVYTQFISLSTNEDVDEWISPIPTYYSDFEDCSKLTNETFACKIGGGTGLLNTTTMDFSIGTTEGIKHPDTLLYPKDGKIIKKKYNNTIRYSIILVPTEQGYKNIAMSPELTESMFTRLYFLDGIGLNHFKKFSDKENLFGNRITIWKIDWEGSRTN